MIIDIPFYLLIISVMAFFSLIGVIFLAYFMFSFVRTIKRMLVSVPTVSPKTLNDLEERAIAIDKFNRGDINALKEYWDKFYDSKMQRM